MKKQIITITCVALAALILFTTYAIFFRDDGIEEVGDPFYTLSDEIKESLAEIEADVEITLKGYDGDDDGLTAKARNMPTAISSKRFTTAPVTALTAKLLW